MIGIGCVVVLPFFLNYKQPKIFLQLLGWFLWWPVCYCHQFLCCSPGKERNVFFYSQENSFGFVVKRMKLVLLICAHFYVDKTPMLTEDCRKYHSDHPPTPSQLAIIQILWFLVLNVKKNAAKSLYFIQQQDLWCWWGYWKTSSTLSDLSSYRLASRSHNNLIFKFRLKQ